MGHPNFCGGLEENKQLQRQKRKCGVSPLRRQTCAAFGRDDGVFVVPKGGWLEDLFVGGGEDGVFGRAGH